MPQSNCQRQAVSQITLAHLWVLVVILGIFIFVNTHPIRPHDFWWHIAAGREIVGTGRIPRVDTYSFTAPGEPYPSYQMFWLPEAVLFLVYDHGGSALVVFVHGLLVTAAYALVLGVAFHISRDLRVAAGVTFLAAALGIQDWNVRPQAFTFWLAPLFLLAIVAYRDRGDRRWLVVFPVGMVLWVNSHGTFVLGLVIVGLWLADEVWRAVTPSLGPWAQSPGEPDARHPSQLKTAMGTLLLALAACLLNPRGPGIVSYLTTMTTDPVVRNLVPEWAPPSFASWGGRIFLIAILAEAGLLAVSPRRPRPLQLLAYLSFAGLGLMTVRGSIWFGLVVAPLLADHLALTLRHLGIGSSPEYRGPAKLNAAVAALLLASAILTLPWFKSLWPLPDAKAGLISAETPVAATDYLLDAQPPGPLFHAMSFGSYLAWAAQPEYPVFVDARIELYPPSVWLDYIDISAAGCDWQDRLDGYGIETLFLSPTEQAPLLATARSSPEWRELYADPVAVILTRDREAGSD